jgi:hypothetical protein
MINERLLTRVSLGDETRLNQPIPSFHLILSRQHQNETKDGRDGREREKIKIKIKYYRDNARDEKRPRTSCSGAWPHENPMAIPIPSASSASLLKAGPWAASALVWRGLDLLDLLGPRSS